MNNCKNCIRFKTCQFVEKNKEFAKQMYSMFEYPEWNNLEEVFFKNANSCKFFIDNDNNVEDLLKKIETAKYQMGWIHNYVERLKDSTEPASVFFQNLLKITEDYKAALDK